LEVVDRLVDFVDRSLELFTGEIVVAGEAGLVQEGIDLLLGDGFLFWNLWRWEGLKVRRWKGLKVEWAIT